MSASAEDWMPRISAMFRMYDLDADGYLGREDLLAYARHLADRLTAPGDTVRRAALHDAYAELWTQLAAVSDTDRSGKISEQEFVAACARHAFDANPHFRVSTLRALDVLADALDRDEDGSIDPQEYEQLFGATGNSTGTGTGIDSGNEALSFAVVDTNGDGRISCEELRAIAVHLYPLADPSWLKRDGDAEPSASRGIALVAHDTRKADLLEWAHRRSAELERHRLYATGTTGSLLSDRLGLPVTSLRSGPLGGDQQIGALITQGVVDLLIFFWDPLTAHPHGDDVRALIRLSVLAEIPVALNSASADVMITSAALTCAPSVATPEASPKPVVLSAF